MLSNLGRSQTEVVGNVDYVVVRYVDERMAAVCLLNLEILETKR